MNASGDNDPLWFEPLPRGDGPDAASRADESVPASECWRCGKWVDLRGGFCPVCRAPGREDRRQPLPAPRHDDRPWHTHAADVPDFAGIKALLWAFGILLLVSLVQGLWLNFGSDLGGLGRERQQQGLLAQLIVFEAVATVVVLAAIAWATRPPPASRPGEITSAAWLVALPVLAVLLAINWGYHQVLLELVGRPQHFEIVELDFNFNPGLVIAAICIQPAVVEELFFRYLALGHLRTVMGMHGAVWVSSVMFGMAHVHVPLSIPILIVVGAGLGYLRVMSGGLALPMLMHALHNAVVLTIESKP